MKTFRGAWKSGNAHKTTRPTPEEARKRAHLVELRKQAQNIENKIRRLFEACTHPIYYDAPGDPYDVRVCYVCGKSELI